MSEEMRPEQVVSQLRADYGDSLRVVAAYDRDTYTILYDAGDAETVYTERDMELIYDDLVLEEVEQPFQERLFGDMGSVEGKIRIFEAGTVAHFWPTDDKDGLFVSLDADADPGVRSLLAVAQAYYN